MIGKRRRFLGGRVLGGSLMMVLAAGFLLSSCGRVPEVVTTTTEGVKQRVLAAGEDWPIVETTRLDILTIGEGATITPPPGKTVTLTVDGTEQGQRLASTEGYELVFVPGTYTGTVVLTVAEGNPVEYAAGSPPAAVIQPFRQALCVDSAGLSEFKSVLAAVVGTMPDSTEAEGLTITSTGECFNGVYAASSYTLKNAEISLTGNGRSDLTGYGAGVMGTGQGTTLVLDGVNVSTVGAVRAPLVASDGANVIAKGCEFQSVDGTLPADYVPTSDSSQIRSAPWMLGISGNVRASNLLGTGTKAAYVNSSISSQGWGALSVEECVSPTLTAINSQISITGEDGFGASAEGAATEYFLGCDFAVPTYGAISKGGKLFFGDSDPTVIAELNSSLRLGLTEAEIATITKKGTVINSLRYGIMWHGDGMSGDAGTANIDGAAVFSTGEAVFLDKGQAVKIVVNGTGGAKLSAGNGVIMQLMDEDNPGYDPATMRNTAVYNEPTTPPEKDTNHWLTRVGDGQDALATFKSIEMTGDFYNSTRGGQGLVAVKPPAGDSTTASSAVSAAPTVTTQATTVTTKPAATVAPSTNGASTTAGAAVQAVTTTTLPPNTKLASVSKNLCLMFDHSKITGIITASTAVHAKPTITSADYRLLGAVTNTPAAPVNNGVVAAFINGSVWTVTGTCYLSSLTITDSWVVAPEGKTLTMTVDGESRKVEAGKYSGSIVLTVE